MLMDGLKSRMESTEEHINDFEDKIIEFTQSKQQKGKRKQMTKKLTKPVEKPKPKDLQNHSKRSNIRVSEEKQKRTRLK